MFTSIASFEEGLEMSSATGAQRAVDCSEVLACGAALGHASQARTTDALFEQKRAAHSLSDGSTPP